MRVDCREPLVAVHSMVLTATVDVSQTSSPDHHMCHVSTSNNLHASDTCMLQEKGYIVRKSITATSVVASSSSVHTFHHPRPSIATNYSYVSRQLHLSCYVIYCRFVQPWGWSGVLRTIRLVAVRQRYLRFLLAAAI